MTEPQVDSDIHDDPSGESAALKTPTNGYLLFLLIAGPVIAVIGFLGAIVQYQRTSTAASISQLEGTLVGGTPYFGGPDYTTTWIWAIVGIIGLVLLIIGIAIRAATQPKP